VPATRSSAYNWQDLLPLTGNNFYRLRCAGIAGDVKLSQVIRVKAGNSAAGISVYTNPVVNHNLALQFTRMEKGTYRVNLLNAGGQLLSTNSLLHGGGTALQILLLQQGIPGGNYLLQVIHPGQATTTQKLLIAE
jgi:hypothetical protein